MIPMTQPQYSLSNSIKLALNEFKMGGYDRLSGLLKTDPMVLVSRSGVQEKDVIVGEFVAAILMEKLKTPTEFSEACDILRACPALLRYRPVGSQKVIGEQVAAYLVQQVFDGTYHPTLAMIQACPKLFYYRASGTDFAGRVRYVTPYEAGLWYHPDNRERALEFTNGLPKAINDLSFLAECANMLDARYIFGQLRLKIGQVLAMILLLAPFALYGVIKMLSIIVSPLQPLANGFYRLLTKGFKSCVNLFYDEQRGAFYLNSATFAINEALENKLSVKIMTGLGVVVIGTLETVLLLAAPTQFVLAPLILGWPLLILVPLALSTYAAYTVDAVVSYVRGKLSSSKEDAIISSEPDVAPSSYLACLAVFSFGKSPSSEAKQDIAHSLAKDVPTPASSAPAQDAALPLQPTALRV